MELPDCFGETVVFDVCFMVPDDGSCCTNCNFFDCVEREDMLLELYQMLDIGTLEPVKSCVGSEGLN